MRAIRFLCASLALGTCLGLSGMAGAATVDITKDYGGAVTPIYGSGGTMAADHVSVIDRNDTTGNRFFDKFNFGALVSGTVNSIKLTLHYSLAPHTTSFGFSKEDWRVYGTTNGGTSTTDRIQVGNRLSSSSTATWTATFTSGSVFSQALTSGVFAFWFGDEGYAANDFNLYSAAVTVDYTPATVPLPAGGILLLGGLGGLALLRRRKAV